MSVKRSQIFKTLACCHILAAGTTCLPNAIPEDQRQNITIDGVSMPLGIVVVDWDSAIMASEVYGILASELLGYNVRFRKVSGVLTELLALSGCSSQDLDQCTFPTEHIGLEVWSTILDTGDWKDISKQLGGASAVLLGSVGYTGYDGMFVLGRANDESRAATGLHLTFYGNYNASWFRPEKCAATISDVDIDLLRPCGVVNTAYPTAARLYLDATGDIEGVEDQDGRKAYRCWLEKWWLAPACRADARLCISLLTAGDGWAFSVMSQQANFHNIPVGIAVASSFGTYLEINRELQSLLYSWTPDSNFALYIPTPIQFPQGKESEIERGIYQSMQPRSMIYKAVSPSLEGSSNRAFGLVENLHLSTSDIDTLLFQLVQSGLQVFGKNSWSVACEWLKSNTQRWTNWVPDKTTCSSTEGLVDLQGIFVTSKAEAVDCQICPPGRASVELDAGDGRVQFCEICEAGSFQNSFGASVCKLCEPGSFAAQPGSTVCELCPLGFYVDESGKTFCHQCGAGTGQEELWTTSQEVEDPDAPSGIRIIEAQGSDSNSPCACKAGSFLWKGRCQICGEGLTCPGRNRMELLPGYFSTPEAPGEVFICSDGFCPGGPAGTCSTGRDPESVACNNCQDGLREAQGGRCSECENGDYFLISLLFLLVPSLVTALYLGLKIENQSRPSGSLLMVTSGLIQLLIVVQILSVLRRFEIDWREPFRSVLIYIEIISLDLEMLSISCVVSVGPVGLFIFRSALIPMLILMILLVHLSFLGLTGSKTFQASNFWRAAGKALLIFFIVFFSMLLAPFHCGWHPNGLSTVKRYGTVFCNGQGQHLRMFIIGGFACLMPTLFLATCTWIVMVELPSRLARSDTRFLANCSFLIRRFRPGAEITSVLFLLRNVCVSLCPLLSSTSAQLSMMSLILYVNFFCVSFFRPWRIMSCNLLDCMLIFCLLVILDMGFVNERDSDPQASVIVVMIFVVLMALAISAVVLQGNRQYFQQKFKFCFFACHQKNAAGSLARLLKMELEMRLPGTKTFIDCDDLRDLAKLFTYIGQETEHFLLLASPTVLTRKWCVGELATAFRNDVKTMVLAWPEFRMPDEAFIANYRHVVPEITELASFGISLSDVKETLRWLHTVQSYSLPEKLTAATASAMVTAVTARLQPPFRSMFAGIELQTKCPVLVDPEDEEAVATAMVLSALLKPQLVGTNLPLPSLLSENGKVPEGSLVALVICNSECFKSPLIEQWLLQASQQPSCGAIPVITNDCFLMPSPTLYETLRATSLLEPTDFQNYCRAIKALFNEIAVVFMPQNYSSTHEELQLRANYAAVRMRTALKPLFEKVKLLEASVSFKREVSAYSAPSEQREIARRSDDDEHVDETGSVIEM